MVRLSKIILSLLILSFSFEVQAKNPPPGSGTSDIPANILIMLDTSGSMNNKLYNSVQVYYPLDVATDSSGNVYVMEYYNNRIKVFDSSGAYLRSFGGYGNGCNQWQYARQFIIYNDVVYIADTYGRKVKSLTLTGQCKDIWFTGQYPHAIAANSNYVFVGHPSNSISVLDHRLNQRSTESISSNYLSYAWGMSINSTGNRLAIADYNKNQVVEFSISGTSLSYTQRTSSSYSSSNGYYRRPTDTGYDSSGNIYALDLYNHRIQKKNSSLAYQTKTGSYSTSSGFRYPYGMHIDSRDNIYVTDFYNYAVRKYNTSLSETATYGGGGGTLLDAAKKVIKKIVSNTDLTSGANFGFMQWASSNTIRVRISDTGAKSIYTDVDNVTAYGGTNLLGAMQNASNYFTSGQVANWNKTCSINYLIVISDGYWSSHSRVLNIANTLNNTHKIKTFAVGLNLSGSTSNYTTLAAQGGTTAPLYASNETELLAKLTDAIKQAISGRLTFTTPAVMSDVTKGDFIYQSTFEYEKNKQWKGSLKKYKLNSDGTFGNAIWDAATKLNSKNASSRNIWTLHGEATGINNFTTTYRDALKSLMFPSQSPTNTQVENLINFIRGVDTYDQDADNNKTESIHKLADIYHSDIAIVSPPEASTTVGSEANAQKKDSYYRSQNNYNNFKSGNTCGGLCKDRKEILLAGANNGLLHAFDTSNGEELWAYLPPNMIGNLEKIPSNNANVTNAIYGIDGSPIVKDIYYDDTPDDGRNNPVWKTIALVGLGAGGHGYFALDITNPQSPTHLFAIENDPVNQAVKHWDKDGFKNEFGYAGGGISANMDYRKLGEAWSTPRIIRVKHNGKDKWVAVFGAGYNGSVNPNYGSAVFVMDLEDEGRLLQKIDITDLSSSNIVNSVPADLTVITANGTDKANYNGAMVYAADLEGKITKINLTDTGTMYQTTTLFNSESNSSNGRYIYKRAQATINDGDLWLYFGTGNTQKLQEQSTNIKNRVYGIKDKNFPRFRAINSPGTISQCKTAPTCPGGGDLGWYVELKNKQKLTAEPTVFKDRVFYPIYEPTSGTTGCNTGTALLTAYNSKCGNSVLNVNVGKGVLTKVVVQKDNLYIGLAGEAKENISGFTSKDNLITGKSKAKGGGSITVEGWKEN